MTQKQKLIIPSDSMYYIIGVHKETGVPKVFHSYKIPEAAQQKMEEIKKSHVDFINNINKLNLEHQCPTAKELGIKTMEEYVEYQMKHKNQTAPMINQFATENMPEDFDYNFYLDITN